jgi:hypothetical protein
MDWKKRLDYDGSGEAKLSILLDILLFIVFISWGLFVVNTHFARGVDDGLVEINCIMTSAVYHNMVWNNSDLVFGKSNGLFDKNDSELMDMLLKQNFTYYDGSRRTIGELVN